jgi:hypothetical protein
MKNTILAVTIIFFANANFVFAQNTDSREVLEWVKQTARRVDQSLQNAINTQDWSILLLSLMECEQEFGHVAIAGLYCHEARIAAERGRAFCDLNNTAYPKDLSSCTLRATEGRKQAILMRDAALDCLRQNLAMPTASSDSLTLANLLQTNAGAIEQDLTEGINSNDFHVLMAKLDHAHRIFQETMHMTNSLEQCKEIHKAAVDGENETMSALLKIDWNVCVQHARQALVHAQTIKRLAPDCHITER